MLRHALIAIVLGALLAQTVNAADRVEIFADEALTQTSLDDTTPRLVEIYVAQVETTGLTGCSFTVAASPGFTGVWVADTTPWVHLGNTQTGFFVAYGYCMMGTAIMVKITYQLFGTSSCSSLHTAGIPGWAVDTPICDVCAGEYPVPVSSLAVNCPVPTEPTTWGKVKALYRN